jgi:hypothetical protein
LLLLVVINVQVGSLLGQLLFIIFAREPSLYRLRRADARLVGVAVGPNFVTGPVHVLDSVTARALNDTE